MTWTIGARRVIGCGCVARVEWRVPNTRSLYAVRIEGIRCGRIEAIRSVRSASAGRLRERHP